MPAHIEEATQYAVVSSNNGYRLSSQIASDILAGLTYLVYSTD
jgi:hypothetical protein